MASKTSSCIHPFIIHFLYIRLAVMHTSYIDPILYFLSSSYLFSRKIDKISRRIYYVIYTFSSFSDFHRKSNSKGKSLICTLWIKKWVYQLVLKSDFLSKTKSRIWMILNFTKKYFCCMNLVVNCDNRTVFAFWQFNFSVGVSAF